MKDTYSIGMYFRLSEEDEDKKNSESNSISAQRCLIKNFIASDSELSGCPAREFFDDGYTGTNFDREGVQALLGEVKKGTINCIIVKDFSRFGRSYLEVSRYIEQIFPYLNVRFISINDKYDSIRFKGTTAGLDVPLKNLIYAMYSKDISKKVKSAKRTKMVQAQFANAQAIYGYKKSAKKGKLEIDEEAAAVVRRIFEMAKNGSGIKAIADILNTEKVLTPAQYKKKCGIANVWSADEFDNVWKRTAVSRILHDEQYTGAFIAGKWEAGRLGSNKARKTKKEEWIVIPDTFEAIISPEDFAYVASLSQKKNKNDYSVHSDRILYKKVKCGYCNHLLVRKETSEPFYYCDTALYSDKFGCSADRIPEKDILELVLQAIQTQVKLALDAQKLVDLNCSENNLLLKSIGQQLLEYKSEIQRLKSGKLKTYESYKNGLLDKDSYFKEREKLEAVIAAKEADALSLQSQYDALNEKINHASRYLKVFLQYEFVNELTKEMVDALIREIRFYGRERVEVVFTVQDVFESQQ